MAKSSIVPVSDRREKIMEAALPLFLRSGLRGATMEGIAKAAGVAKPTLYSYFPDKEAVFIAVVDRQVLRMRELAEEALAAPASGTERVANALGAKYKYLFRLLNGSPHANELYAEGRTGAFPAFESWFEGEIARQLAAEGHEHPHRLMSLIIACADGIAKRAQHAEEIGPAIRFVVQKLTA